MNQRKTKTKGRTKFQVQRQVPKTTRTKGCRRRGAFGQERKIAEHTRQARMQLARERRIARQQGEQRLAIQEARGQMGEHKTNEADPAGEEVVSSRERDDFLKRGGRVIGKNAVQEKRRRRRVIVIGKVASDTHKASRTVPNGLLLANFRMKPKEKNTRASPVAAKCAQAKGT